MSLCEKENFVKAKLKEWGCEVLYPVFKFKGITETNFFHLTDEQLDGLILNKTMKEYFTQKYLDALIEKSNIDNETVENTRVPLSDVTNVNETNNEVNESVHDQYVQTVVNEVLTSPVIMNKFKNYSKYYSELQQVKPLFIKLSSSFIGKVILFHYSETQELLQKQLCAIIVDMYMDLSLETAAPFVFDSNIFERIVLDIKELFPTESKSKSFYSQSFTSVVDGVFKRTNAGGPLYKVYISIRDTLGYVKLLNPASRKNCNKKYSTAPATVSLQLNDLYLPNPEDEELVIKTWTLSFHQRHSIEYEKRSVHDIFNTYQVLKGPLATKLINIDFQGKLIDHKGIESSKFVDTQIADRLISHWSSISNKIINLAKTKASQTTKRKSSSSIAPSKKQKVTEDPLNQVSVAGTEPSLSVDVAEPKSPDTLKVERIDTDYTNLYSVLKDNDVIEGEDHKCALAFLLLVSLIRYIYRGKNSSNYKSNITHAAPCFAEHIKVPESINDLQAFVHYKKQELANLNIVGVVPYVIFCGPLHAIESSYVVVDEIIYTCSSVTKAIDLCFKTFFAFNLDFPLPSTHLWAFIHIYVYEIKGLKTIFGLSKILQLADELNKIKD